MSSSLSSTSSHSNLISLSADQEEQLRAGQLCHPNRKLLQKIKQLLKTQTNDPNQLCLQLQTIIQTQPHLINQQLANIISQFQDIKNNHIAIKQIAQLLSHKINTQQRQQIHKSTYQQQIQIQSNPNTNKYLHLPPKSPHLKTNDQKLSKIQKRNKQIEIKIAKMCGQLKKIKEQLHIITKGHQATQLKSQSQFQLKPSYRMEENYQQLQNNQPQSYVLSLDGQWIPENQTKSDFFKKTIIMELADPSNQSNAIFIQNKQQKHSKEIDQSHLQPIGKEIEDNKVNKDQKNSLNNTSDNISIQNKQKNKEKNILKNEKEEDIKISLKQYARNIQSKVQLITKAKTISEIYSKIQNNKNQSEIQSKKNHIQIIKNNSQKKQQPICYMQQPKQIKNNNQAVGQTINNINTSKNIKQEQDNSNKQGIKINLISAKDLLQNMKNVESQLEIPHQLQEKNIKGRFQQLIAELKNIHPKMTNFQENVKSSQSLFLGNKNLTSIGTSTQAAPTSLIHKYIGRDNNFVNDKSSFINSFNLKTQSFIQNHNISSVVLPSQNSFRLLHKNGNPPLHHLPPHFNKNIAPPINSRNQYHQRQLRHTVTVSKPHPNHYSIHRQSIKPSFPLISSNYYSPLSRANLKSPSQKSISFQQSQLCHCQILNKNYKIEENKNIIEQNRCQKCGRVSKITLRKSHSKSKGISLTKSMRNSREN